MWVLVLMITYYGGSMVKIDGFTSKANCEFAAKEFSQRAYTYCIEVK